MNQIEKNTVKAENQLKPNEDVTFENIQNSGKRIMFAGNSSTLHGKKPDIGWNNVWGMAASAKEKDYVHVLESYINKVIPDASYCICQAYKWERDYPNGKEVYPIYQPARDFNSDIIVVRMVENCPWKNFDAVAFKREYVDFINFLNKSGKAKIILTTSFWKHAADEIIEQVSVQTGWPLVKINDLGEDDSMKAIGLFEHNGVANHPGDKGMKTIADRIFEVLKNSL